MTGPGADNVAAGGYDAVVLAGGTSRRMGVADKTRLVVAGVPLLDRVLGALAAADRLVVVGPERPAAPWGPGCVDAPKAPRRLIWTRERPPGGGPAAAIAAGLERTAAPIVVLAAGDLPLLTPGSVDRLVAAVGERAGAVVADPNGGPQWLCSAWRREALLTAPLEPGGSLHGALAPLEPVTLDLGCTRGWLDCDTPEDLARAERLLADKV